MTLDTLLIRAGVSRYDAHLWFSHAQLVGADLIVTDPGDAGVIRRCYLPLFKALDLDIKILETKAAPKPVPTKKPTDLRNVIKRKHWKDAGLEESDLLD